jgi:hypothetical protein
VLRALGMQDTDDDVPDKEAQDYAIVHGHLDDQYISAESDIFLGSKFREVSFEILDLLLLVGLFIHKVLIHIVCRVLWVTDMNCCFLELWTMLILLPRSVRENVPLAVKDE